MMGYNDIIKTINNCPGFFDKKGRVNANIQRTKRFESIILKINKVTNFLPPTAKLAERVYCIKNNITKLDYCAECGTKIVLFKNVTLGYSKFCSNVCSNKSSSRTNNIKKTKFERYGDENYNNREKSKETVLDIYGVENVAMDITVKEKVKKTNLEKYGVSSPLANSEIKSKAKQTKLEKYGDINYNNRELAKETNLERYGVTCPLAATEVKLKSKQTRLEKYGDENYVNVKKRKKTNLEKYGVSSPLANSEIKSKAKQTKLEKYGDINYNNRELAKETNLERYGAENFSQTEEFRRNRIDTNLKKYGVEHKCQLQISTESLERLNDKDWLIDQHHAKKKCLSEIACDLDVDNTTVSNYMRRHNIETKIFYSSMAQKTLKEYIETKYITRVRSNIRSIIPPKEIDIWVPEFRLAIEFNGIFWHSPERCGGVDKWFEYHQYKIDECEKKDIRLLHLWENYGDHELLIEQAINGFVYNNLEQVFSDLYA